MSVSKKQMESEAAVEATLFDDEYQTEAETLEKLVLRAINADGTLRNNKQSVAIECLGLSRDALRRVDARYKELVEPIKKQLAPYDTERSKLKAAYERVEIASKSALLDELKDAGELPEESDNGVRLSIITKPKVYITDASKVPDRFLLPREQCIDKEALLEHLKKERAAHAVMAELNPKHGSPKTTAPGAELVDEVILSTKLPEIIA